MSEIQFQDLFFQDGSKATLERAIRLHLIRSENAVLVDRPSNLRIQFSAIHATGSRQPLLANGQPSMEMGKLLPGQVENLIAHIGLITGREAVRRSRERDPKTFELVEIYELQTPRHGT